MRDQIKLTFQIGYPVQNEKFERRVAHDASRLCGGCTTSTAKGYWMSDGSTHADTFTGRLEDEHTFQLELTCEPHKLDRVHYTMARAIANWAYAYSIKTDWVHVTETEMRGRHFSVAAINRALDAA